MKLRKIISSVVIGMFAVFMMAVSVSANVVFDKDFRTSQNLDEFIPSPNAGLDLKEPEFNENGLYISKLSANFTTYIIDFEKSGIEINSDKYYLATFEGKALVENPQKFTMIIQLLGTGAGGQSDWQNIDSADGTIVVQDGKGYPINEDGTFKCVGLIKPEHISSDRYSELIGVCMWGCYGNNPVEYEVNYMKIEECDPSDYIIAEAQTEDTAAAEADTAEAEDAEPEPSPEAPEPAPEAEPEPSPEAVAAPETEAAPDTTEPAPEINTEPDAAADAQTAPAADNNATADTTKSNSNTGVVVAIIVAVIVVISAVAFILYKRKK